MDTTPSEVSNSEDTIELLDETEALELVEFDPGVDPKRFSSNLTPVGSWQKNKRKLVSFPSLYLAFCSSVFLDNNTWKQKSYEKGKTWVNSSRVMTGGRKVDVHGAGPIVDSAGPRSVHCPVG